MSDSTDCLIASSTNTPFSTNTSGTGDWNQKSSTSVISHSMRFPQSLCFAANSTSDPFMHMELNNKTYGFTIAVKELKETVPNLFRYASAYMRANGLKSQGLWEMFLEEQKKPKPKPAEPANINLPEELRRQAGPEKLPDIDMEAMEGEKYNMCHFWSNFEIARLDFFRSKEYEEFFQIMDRSGGFWNERVGSIWAQYLIRSLLTLS